MNYSDQKQDKLISAMKLQVTSTGIGALIASIWTASLPISVCVLCVGVGEQRWRFEATVM